MFAALVFVLTAGLAYLAGSVSPAWFVGRARGLDLRLEGRETLDFLNVWEVIGRGAGALVFAADALKAAAIVALALTLTGSPAAAAGAGFAAVAGQVWPLFHDFAGGRGIAPLAGVLLAASPWTLVICATLFVLLAALTGLPTHAELLVVALMPGVAVLAGGGDIPLLVMCLAIAGVLIRLRWPLVEVLLGARRAEGKDEGGGS